MVLTVKDAGKRNIDIDRFHSLQFLPYVADRRQNFLLEVNVVCQHHGLARKGIARVDTSRQRFPVCGVFDRIIVEGFAADRFFSAFRRIGSPCPGAAAFRFRVGGESKGICHLHSLFAFVDHPHPRVSQDLRQVGFCQLIGRVQQFIRRSRRRRLLRLFRRCFCFLRLLRCLRLLRILRFTTCLRFLSLARLRLSAQIQACFRKGKAHLRKDHHQAEQQAKNFFAPVALSLFHADTSSPRFFWFFIFYYLSFIETDL